MPLTAADIAQHLGGAIRGDGSVVITGFAPANAAKPGDLTFAETSEYFAAAEKSAATAILVAGDFQSDGKTLIQVPNARVAFARVLPLFSSEATFTAGIHPTAVLGRGAQVDSTAHIGPHCVIGDNALVGARCVLHGGNHVGANSQLGEGVQLFPNVVLYADTQIGHRVRIHAGTVIGSDGFGYVLDGGLHRKVPQIGNVIIHDDVEIGAGVTVDRGALGSTVIGTGSKIDNLVQIAHNVVIGEHCIVVSQAGIAGSTKLGQYVTLAGQVGIAGHLHIGDQAVVSARSGVMHDIPAGEKWFGYPAQPDRQFKRQTIAIHQLPALLRRVAALERQLARKNETPA